MNLSRKNMTTWIEIITGQNNLNYVQSKIYNIDPICRFCNEEDETFIHLLNECPCFREIRCEILLSRATAIEDWTMENILKFANLKQIKYALSYEGQTRLFLQHGLLQEN